MIDSTAGRLTLVVGSSPNGPAWTSPSVLRVGALPMVHGAFAQYDIERIVLDRSNSTDEFLRLLTALPAELAGDVVFVRECGGAFLSAPGRGGDRVLYALAEHDLRFYLETHGLTEGLVEYAQSA